MAERITRVPGASGAFEWGAVTYSCAAKARVLGVKEETLEKFIDAGYIKEFADIFHLDRYYEEIVATPGFGQKSYDNLKFFDVNEVISQLRKQKQ